MLPDQHPAKLIGRIARKEIALFFASPIAYLFLATFAAVTLFIFFWGEAFFARNIADVRPMFEWMPLLLVFLTSTLTMRLWSEERRSGTLEHVLTQPVPLWHFVLGKFTGCVVLLILALAITLPLPMTVAILGELDWGPVIAGYLASLLLGAAYLSIGLFVSARSDNQIVSLISASALCGLFYLIGTPALTDFFGTNSGEVLRLLGTGSRFESITRGVIDLRDLYYYISIMAAFLTLNTFVLEKERWSGKGDPVHHSRWRSLTILLLANAVAANLWLGQLTSLRVDATAGNQYSISEATQGYLNQLQEPLLLRGYFSAKTHPLLAPLVPQLRDLMEEFAIAGNGRVQLEFIDPATNPEQEQEANERYGIEAVPFQIADRYQSSIVSSYFNVLVQYGDEFKVLGFQELIEVLSADAGTNIDVQLRNPEYDLTAAIRSVMNDYQAGGNLFDTVKGELKFTAYVSNDSLLPEQLKQFKSTVTAVTNEISGTSSGRLQVEFVDPDANGGAVAQQIASDYGFRPMATSLFSDEKFYFYLTLQGGDQIVQIPLDDLSEGSFERNLNAGIKRFASGFTRTIAVVAGGKPDPIAAQYGAAPAQFNQLRAFLGNDANLVDEDLGDGSVAGNADLLLLLAPENLDEKAVFAVDQFLMQGGTVIAATSPYKVSLAGNTLSMQNVTSGLEDWLKHQGLNIEKQLVMDPQNAAFPIPVTRNVGGFRLQDWRMLDYPYFLDVRGAGLNDDHITTADLPQVTIAWSSPITTSVDTGMARTITPLLRSSPDAWLSDSTDVMPMIDASGQSSYQPAAERAAQVVGVISAGQFTSYFAGKDSPLLTAASESGATEPAPTSEDETPAAPAATSAIGSVIEKSPESARIILFSSNDFLSDQILGFLGTATNSDYQNSMQLMANAMDFALEDASLLGIRSRSHFNRTLPPLEQNQQVFWEYLNYVLAALALGVIALLHKRRKDVRQLQFARYVSN